MKNLFLDYYNDFHCIANKCKDSCCERWNIVIDDETYDKYCKVDGEFGSVLKCNIKTDKRGHTVIMKNSRCPFLNKDNLCDIYINLGEDSLSDVCYNHPRFFLNVGGITFKNLSFSCEEVARIILNHKDKLEIVEELDDKPPMLNDVDAEYYHKLFCKLTEYINYFQEEDVALSTKIKKLFNDGKMNFDDKFIKKILKRFYKCEIDSDVTKRIILSLEKYDENTFYKRLDEYNEKYKIQNVIITLLFRYYMTAVYDYKETEKLRFVSLATAIITCALFYTEYDDVAVLTNYSREILHDGDNIKILEKVLRR